MSSPETAPAGPSRSVITCGPEETQALGAALGRAAQPGDVLCLEGPLGVGKTVLVQGLAQGLGVTESVTSPSFTLVHEHRGRLPLYHIDLYRLDTALVDDLFVEEYLDGGGVTAIEWADRLPPALGGACLHLDIAYDDDDRRVVAITPRGDRATAWAQAIPRRPAGRCP